MDDGSPENTICHDSVPESADTRSIESQGVPEEAHPNQQDTGQHDLTGETRCQTEQNMAEKPDHEVEENPDHVVVEGPTSECDDPEQDVFDESYLADISRCNSASTCTSEFYLRQSEQWSSAHQGFQVVVISAPSLHRSISSQFIPPTEAISNPVSIYPSTGPTSNLFLLL